MANENNTLKNYYNEDPDNYIYPSLLKRFAVLVIWYIVIVAILMFITINIYKIFFNVDVDSSSAPKSYQYVRSFVQFAPLAFLILLSAKARLPGAMRKKKENV